MLGVRLLVQELGWEFPCAGGEALGTGIGWEFPCAGGEALGTGIGMGIPPCWESGQGSKCRN